MSHETHMTTQEVAAELRTSVGYVCRLARRGEIPAFKLGSRTSPYRFKRDDVTAWIESRVEFQAQRAA